MIGWFAVKVIWRPIIEGGFEMIVNADHESRSVLDLSTNNLYHAKRQLCYEDSLIDCSTVLRTWQKLSLIATPRPSFSRAPAPNPTPVSSSRPPTTDYQEGQDFPHPIGKPRRQSQARRLSIHYLTEELHDQQRALTNLHTTRRNTSTSSSHRRKPLFYLPTPWPRTWIAPCPRAPARRWTSGTRSRSPRRRRSCSWASLGPASRVCAASSSATT